MRDVRVFRTKVDILVFSLFPYGYDYRGNLTIKYVTYVYVK